MRLTLIVDIEGTVEEVKNKVVKRCLAYDIFQAADAVDEMDVIALLQDDDRAPEFSIHFETNMEDL
jgi:hypothetical protein